MTTAAAMMDECRRLRQDRDCGSQRGPSSLLPKEGRRGEGRDRRRVRGEREEEVWDVCAGVSEEHTHTHRQQKNFEIV